MSNTDRQTKFNQLIKDLKEYASEPEEKLVYFLKREGYKTAQIAEALEITKQRLGQKYPNLSKEI